MHPYSAQIFPTPKGFMLAGMVLAKRNPDGTFAINGHEEEIHALVSATYGKPISPRVIDYIKRAGKLFAHASDEELEAAAYPSFPNPHVKATSGDDIIFMVKGLMTLALTGINSLDDVPMGKSRFTKARKALDAGATPRALLKQFDLVPQDIDAIHTYNLDKRHYAGHSATKFDFVAQVARGKTLLIGEGNLSFALSLARMKQIMPGNLTATTFEPEADWSLSIQANAKALQHLGTAVLNGVDATDLAATLGTSRFDNIVFQFPHTGSRDEVEGHNSNFILVRDFLISAAAQLAPGGQVLISAVNSPYYQGAFQFDEAADIAGFLPPEMYRFDPSTFPGYEHTMTHQDGSALENHEQFSTWVFRLSKA